jgi:hypothetical protein
MVIVGDGAEVLSIVSSALPVMISSRQTRVSAR